MNVEEQVRRAMTELAETQPPVHDLAGRARAGLRRSRRRRAVPGLAVAAAFVVGGLALAGLDRPGPTVLPGSSFELGRPDCAGLLAEGAPAPEPVRLPRGTRVTEVVQCISERPGTVLDKQARTGLQPLVDALSSGDAWSWPWRTCTVDWGLVDLGQLWVRTGTGRWVRPRLPTDSCGKPQEEVYEAVRGQHFDSIDPLPLRPLSTRTEPTCLDVAAGRQPAVHPVALPSGPAVTTAVLCRREAGPARAEVVKRRATGDLTGLAAALRRPDDHTPLPVGLTCANAAVPDLGRLWLRLADGRWIMPRWPTTNCGLSQPAAVAALDATRFVAVTRLPDTR